MDLIPVVEPADHADGPSKPTPLFRPPTFSTDRLRSPKYPAIINHMVEHVPSAMDSVFHALADRTRRAMVHQLASGQRTVSELAAPHAMSLAAASKHVRVLEDAGLLSRAIEGRVHRCSLERQPLVQALSWLRTYTDFWNERLDALQEMLNDEGSDDRH